MFAAVLLTGTALTAISGSLDGSSFFSVIISKEKYGSKVIRKARAKGRLMNERCGMRRCEELKIGDTCSAVAVSRGVTPAGFTD